MSVRLLGSTFSTCAAKECRGLRAWPLTKYASTPPSTITAAVMYQLVVMKDACAPWTMMVSS